MIHATADESFASSARIGAGAVDAAVAALRRGVAVICDTRMVVAGIPGVATAHCFLDRAPTAPPGDTRSAAAIEVAAAEHPDGALWVIGNAPTALARLLELADRGAVRPAGVVGLPVGYVGAAEAKAALWGSPLQALAITNMGYRGGSPVAAAAVNALAALAARKSPTSGHLA
jgi:precorrin-8X/cobalt-precorrin-8 methylmutase